MDSSGPRPAVVLAVVGGLGDAVAPELRSRLVQAGHDVAAARPAAGPGATAAGAPIGILVADSGDPAVDRFSDTWRAAGLVSLAVVHEHPDVRVGPLDVPGTELCAACVDLRSRQFGGGPPPAAEPLALSVAGFPPYLVTLVAGLAVGRLAALDEDADTRRSQVTVVDTVTLGIRTLPVVPVQGCPRCAVPATAGDQLAAGGAR